jgi:exopolysaccharide biosynthesis polyprenyl glycosylphosphotransferase
MEVIGDSVSPAAPPPPVPTAAAPAADPARHGRAQAYHVLARLFVLCVDAAAINLAFYVAYRSRYVLGLGGDVTDENFVEYHEYLPVVLGVTALVLVFFHLRGLYNLARGTAWFDEVLSVAAGAFYGVALVSWIVLLVRYTATSRLTFVFSWVAIVVLVALGRTLARLLRILARRRGLGIARVVVVGDNSAGRMIMQSIADQPYLGYQVAGFLALTAGPDFGRFKHLGTLEELPKVCELHGVDEVIIALPSVFHREILGVRDHCQRDGLRFKLVPDLYELSLNRVELDAINGIPLLSIKETTLHGWNQLTKRALDVLLAGGALMLFAPLWALIALAIKLDSPGPVLFRQERVGRGETRFQVLKFRSMREDADQIVHQLLGQNEATGPLFKIKNDPRLTRVGRVLRRWSLDEWPQLVNVLRGEMSLVGPRPPLPREVEQYEAWHRRRLEAAPGLTGLWQVSGRSELGFDEMVMLDLYYIENWSLGLDVRILLRTIPAVFRGRGAF